MLRQMGCSNIPSFCLGMRKRGVALLLQGGCACEVSQGRANNVMASPHSLLLDSSNLLQQALLELFAVPSDNGPMVMLVPSSHAKGQGSCRHEAGTLDSMILSHLCKPEAIKGERCVAQGIRIAPHTRSLLGACMQRYTP